jgi:hypothetical protein
MGANGEEVDRSDLAHQSVEWGGFPNFNYLNRGQRMEWRAGINRHNYG